MSKKEDFCAAASIAAFYAAMELVGITCPIRFLTGISCAGCGMSRAWLALLRLDFSAAYAYHPLFWLPIPAAVVYFLRRRMPVRSVKIFFIVVCVLFLAVYLVRLLDPADTVVTCDPAQGIFLRAIRWLVGEQ